MQSVGQLADGNRYAAGAEVVAALDQAGRFGIAEQALKLALFRRITLLHLGTAAFQRLQRVGFGGSGCAAAAVTSGASAQQDDYIGRRGTLTNHVFLRSRAY